VQGLFVTFGFVVAAFFPFLAIYLQDHGLSADQIGIVIAVMAFARIVTNPFWGHYADTRMGRLTALQLGTAGTAIGAVVMSLAHGLPSITIAAVVIAAFMVSTGPNIDAIVLVQLGDERMSDYGRIRGWESASYALGSCLRCGPAGRTRLTMPIFAIAAWPCWWGETVGGPPDGSGARAPGCGGRRLPGGARFWSFWSRSCYLTGFSVELHLLKIVSEGGPFLIGLGAAAGG
jgi:MFS family permease